MFALLSPYFLGGWVTPAHAQGNIMTRFLAVITVYVSITGSTCADDPVNVPRGALGSGAQIGDGLRGIGGMAQNPGLNGPLNQGLGQIVSDWAHDGIHGQELAERIHWLQQTRNLDNSDFRSFRDRDDLR